MVSKFTSVLSSGWVCVASAGSPTRRSALSTSPGVTRGGWYAGGVPPKHCVLTVTHRPSAYRPHKDQRRIWGDPQVSAAVQSTAFGDTVGRIAHTDAHLYCV